MRAPSRSGETAKTLILIGLILDLIGEAILLAVGALFLAVSVFGGLLLGVAAIGLLWVILVWVFSYARVREGDYQGARTPTLVFAILSLISFALIPGVLFIIAYAKLGDAISESVGTPPAWSVQPTPPIPTPVATATPLASASRFCSHCGRANSATSGFCEGCGAPLG